MLFEDHWVYPIPPLMKLHSRINNLTTMGEVFHFPISLIIISLSSNFSIRYHPQERSLCYHPVIICTNCTIIYGNLFDLLSYFLHFSDNSEQISDFNNVRLYLIHLTKALISFNFIQFLF